MTRATRSAILLTVGLFGLSACEEGLNLGQGNDEAVNAAAPATTTTTREGTRDVERPDVFSTTELALWDGRPSLGGIWVAHPDVTDPERAVLINETTGQRVAGALFRRERDNPGPRLQVSSDAAAALNLLAGQPTEMTVIALRREQIVVEEPDPVISDEDVGEDADAETDATETDGGDGDAATAAAATAVAGGAATEAKPRRGFFERIFGPRRQPAADATEAASVADSAATPEVETQTLDPVASTAAAAIARAEADDKPAPRPARAERPANSTVRNPFIQVGQFSVEANAASAASNLRQQGIVPSILQGERNGSTFYRVVVGPVTNADDQAAMLARVKRLGYSDAFLAPN